MSGICKNGFTLLEIIIAVAIVALMTVVTVPSLWRRSPEHERKQAIAQLNSFTYHAWHQAMTTGKVHKVLFNFAQKRVELYRETDKKESNGEPIFEPASRLYIAQSFLWPASLSIKQFIVEGADMMEKFAGRASETAWFFVIPDGLAQAVTINFVDTKDILFTKKPRSFGLVLNPFSAQFSVYDEFQK